MNKFNILAGLIGVIAVFTGYLFLNSQVISVGTELPQAVALFETSLAAPITSTANTMTLTSNSVRGGGSLSGYNCFTIDEGSAQAEFVCGTVATTTVTGLTRGISPLDGTTEDADLKFSHRRGASVKITDFPILQLLRNQNNGSSTFNNTLSYDSAVSIATSSNQITYASWVQQAITGQSVLVTTNQTVAGNKSFTGDISVAGLFSVAGTSTFATTSISILSLTSGTIATTPSGNTDIANKAYVDGVAIAGASDANETTKGITEEATTAEVLAGTATGGTGAKLFITPAKLGSAFDVGTATSSTGAYGNSTSTFTISSNQSYVIYTSGLCYDGNAAAQATGIVSLYVDNKLVRQIGSPIGSDSDGLITGIPFAVTYASSTPAETTVDVLLTSNGQEGCEQLRDVTIDYLVVPR